MGGRRFRVIVLELFDELRTRRTEDLRQRRRGNQGNTKGRRDGQAKEGVASSFSCKPVDVSSDKHLVRSRGEGPDSQTGSGCQWETINDLDHAGGERAAT